MKKSILLIFAICLVSLQGLFAQNGKMTEAKVPAAVKDAFKAKYPNMKVTEWEYETEKSAYSAEFKMNGKEKEAWFGADGKWMKTKMDITKSQLPAAVSKSLTSGEYSTWTMSDYAEMDTPEGKRYKVKAKKGTEELYLKYDESGTLLEKKDKADKKKMMKK